MLVEALATYRVMCSMLNGSTPTSMIVRYVGLRISAVDWDLLLFHDLMVHTAFHRMSEPLELL